MREREKNMPLWWREFYHLFGGIIANFNLKYFILLHKENVCLKVKIFLIPELPTFWSVVCFQLSDPPVDLCLVMLVIYANIVADFTV